MNIVEVTTQEDADREMVAGNIIRILCGNIIVRGNAHAVLWGNAHAELSGNAHAELMGNAHAELSGNAHAELKDNAHAELRGNAHAVLWGNAHAVLRGNAHAVLRDFAAVHVMSSSCRVRVLSDRATIIQVKYPKSIVRWLRLKGMKTQRGWVHMWKCVRVDGTDFRTGQVLYLSDKEIVAPDWDDKFSEECGAALHLADSPEAARKFVNYDLRYKGEFRLLEVRVRLEDCVCFGGIPYYPEKIRARACWLVKEWPKDYGLPWNKE